MQLTTLHIRDITVDVLLGVHAHEQTNTQQIHIDLTYSYDASKAVEQDDMSAAICYDTMYQRVVEFVTQTHFHLLETLAARLSKHLCNLFPSINSLEMTITKPQAMTHARIGIHYTHTS